MGGAINITQLSTKWALRLLQHGVGQSPDAFLAEGMATGKVLWAALALPCWVKHLKAHLALEQAALDLTQNPLDALIALTYLEMRIHVYINLIFLMHRLSYQQATAE